MSLIHLRWIFMLTVASISITDATNTERWVTPTQLTNHSSFLRPIHSNYSGLLYKKIILETQIDDLFDNILPAIKQVLINSGMDPLNVTGFSEEVPLVRQPSSQNSIDTLTTANILSARTHQREHRFEKRLGLSFTKFETRRVRHHVLFGQTIDHQVDPWMEGGRCKSIALNNVSLSKPNESFNFSSSITTTCSGTC